MNTFKRKLRLPLFLANFLIDVSSAAVIVFLATLADEVTIVGYEGSAAIAILALVATVVVGALSAIGFIMRPFEMSCRDYLWKRDW